MTNNIDLNEIHNLKAPSNLSNTDRKMIAFITISVNDKVYESQTFDDGDSPKELKELIDKLFEIAQIN